MITTQELNEFIAFIRTNNDSITEDLYRKWQHILDNNTNSVFSKKKKKEIVNKQDSNGNTILHHAAKYEKNLEIYECLKQYSSDIKKIKD